MAYEDAVEEALSFGWIDSRVNALDEERYMQVFTVTQQLRQEAWKLR